VFKDIPVNKLEDNVSEVSFARHPMLVGRVPCKDVYCMYNNCRLLSCPIVVGRAPITETSYTISSDKLDIDPIVVGIDPATNGNISQE
jgi:hypothetical protein